MLLKPAGDDFRAIGHALGRVVAAMALFALLPAAWAIGRGEWAALSGILLMVGVALLTSAVLDHARPQSTDLTWSQGMVVVATAWLIVPAIGSIPLALSGHFGSWLDAFFEATSGITTTGLTLVQDIDHLPESINIWRHTMQFLGGQGIVLAALTFFAASGILSLFHGEGRDERIFPSVTTTDRFIWRVAAAHALFGILALGLVTWLGLGFGPGRALFHAMNVFMAAFDTGGFASQSTSIGFYHSAVFEAVTAVLMIAGSISFGIHHALWTGRERRARRQRLGVDEDPGILRNLEVRTIITTFGILTVTTLAGLAAAGTYGSIGGLTRRGLFQILSAHTNVGFSTVSSSELAQWQGMAFAGIATAMALGGMASSTAGGVKALRIGLTLRALADSIREALLPDRAVISTNYHQTNQQRLTPELAQSVMAISLLYVALYLVGTAVGYAYGFPLKAALFDSIAAGSNAGLSVGVVSPSMPLALKLVMIMQMYVGRLEFVAVFALIGFVIAWRVGK